MSIRLRLLASRETSVLGGLFSSATGCSDYKVERGPRGVVLGFLHSARVRTKFTSEVRETFVNRPDCGHGATTDTEFLVAEGEAAQVVTEVNWDEYGCAVDVLDCGAPRVLSVGPGRRSAPRGRGAGAMLRYRLELRSGYGGLSLLSVE